MHRTLRISLMSALLLCGYIVYAQEPAKGRPYRTREVNGQRMNVESTIAAAFASDGRHQTAHSPTHR